jgi:gliding motility-associatede transport system auxiliary component
MTSPFLLRLRAYNTAVLSAGLVLVFGGILSVLILNTTNWWNITLVSAGSAVLLLFLTANLAEVKAAGKKRTHVVRASLTLVAAAMLGIVFGLNYIVSRHPIRFDMTSNKIYTLSEQTRDILDKLKQEVDVTMFVSAKRSSAEIQKARQLLEEYAKRSDKFHFRVVDADRDPSEAQRLGVNEINTVVFQSGENRKDVLQRDYITYALQGRQPVPKFQGEGAFTSALLTMTDTSRPVFYFTEGHGEKDMGSPEAGGMNGFKSLLEKENYVVKNINLLTDPKIPADASVIGILGPQRPFQASETAVLEDYLKKGGKLVACVDPMIHSGLGALLKEYGVKLGDDILVDTTMSIPPDPRNLVPQYVSYHPIIQKLSDSHILTIMPFMRSVQKTDPGIPGTTQTVLLQTTDKGWGQTDYKARKWVYKPGKDTKGPVPMAIACEGASSGKPDSKTRLVVFGGSNFLTNQFLQAPGNGDLGINSFSWAAEQENKISIHPKEDDVRVVNLTTVSANLMFYLAVVLIPLAALLIGGIVWYRRRSL